MDFQLTKTNNKLDPKLFNECAKQAAIKIASAGEKINKSTQIRKFYDELVLWDNKTTQHKDKFDEYLPFIQMLNAKVAYAKGRDLVNDDFVNLMNKGLKQVSNPETLHTFKLFMEAFMGFYKQERPNK